MQFVADILVRLTEEQRDLAAQIAGSMGLSVNEYIRRLIQADSENLTEEELNLFSRMRQRKVRGLAETKSEYKVNRKK